MTEPDDGVETVWPGGPLPDSPLPLLAAWLAEARAHEAIRNPDAMALATVDAENHPQVRFVLCRGVDLPRACFTFYTNEESTKGRELTRHPRASAAFYWEPLGRQIRITGPVGKASAADSDAYFATRERLSQLAAWASAQSQSIAHRSALEARLEAMRRRFGDAPIPRPPHWGGFVLSARSIELWSSRAGRLHDRARWVRGENVEGVAGTTWQGCRLQP